MSSSPDSRADVPIDTKACARAATACMEKITSVCTIPRGSGEPLRRELAAIITKAVRDEAWAQAQSRMAWLNDEEAPQGIA